MSDNTDMNKGFLKDKLGNYQVNPPEQMWNEISGQIGGGRKRRGLYILLLASAASIALAISLGLHYFGPDLPRQDSYLEELPVEKGTSEGNKGGEPVGQSGDSKQEPLVAEARADLPDQSTVPSEHENKLNQGAPDEMFEARSKTEESKITVAFQQTDPDLSVNPDLMLGPEPTKNTDFITLPEPATDPLVELGPDPADEIPAIAVPITEQAPKRNPKWMLGAALSPLYSFRDAEAGAIPDNQAESGLLSYSTGVHLSYRRNSRFALETGIYFNKTGIAIGAPGIQVFSQASDNMVFMAGSERADIRTVSNTMGNIIAYSGDIYMNGYKINAENGAVASPGDALNEVSTAESGIQQHLDFLEIPFNLRYSIIDRTIELQLVGGMSTNFLVNNYVTMGTSSGTEKIGYLSNINTVNYSGNAGLGMIYHMGGKLSLSLEPRFRYFINSVNDSTLPTTRPYSLGLYTGLSYTF